MIAPDRNARRLRVTRLREATMGIYGALAGGLGRNQFVGLPAQNSSRWKILLAEAPSALGAQDCARWRGRIDALALHERYSKRGVFEQFLPEEAVARALYSMLEQNRVEALGAIRFAGVRENLSALIHERWIRARPEAVIRSKSGDWVETFALLTRLPLGAPMPEPVRGTFAARWRDWMSAEEALQVERLLPLLVDQAAFAVQSLKVLHCLLGVRSPQHEPAVVARGKPDLQQPNGAVPFELPSGGTADSRPAAGTAVAEPRHASGASGSMPYSVYTTAYDCVVQASELFDAATLAKCRAELDRRLDARRQKIAYWAHRLQRKLLGLQMRSWQFDCEEGELDAGRLTRVLTHPLESLAYKQERQARFPDTVVTLLIDNSGSMRGLPIATAAACAELLGRVLERCGVKTEVLGFTTRSWRGGRAYRDWVSAGRPANPGRLAEVRHVIFKRAEERWRRASVNIGALLADELLKENIDGEALLWAHERLMRRPEVRRVLVVISDGAPLDDATLEANDVQFLERHLHAEIRRIELDSAVELAAIGIGHDVRAYYRRAVTLDSADDLGEAIVTQLINLFESPGRGVHA